MNLISQIIYECEDVAIVFKRQAIFLRSCRNDLRVENPGRYLRATPSEGTSQKRYKK